MIAQKFSLLLLCALALSLTADAQNNWRKNAGEAELLLRKGQYEEAGKLYAEAWESKPAKKELAFQAAESFSFAKDYEKAAQYYGHTLDKPKQFPLAGLKYARALKQNGQYAEASRAFSSFLDAYKGKDPEKMASVVENEIRGCELGMQFQKQPATQGIQLLRLGPNINSNASEFAPIPYNEDILYFSSTKEGKAKIFRSQQEQGVWSSASLSSTFPEIQNQHFCNGALTPDFKRFYFTICSVEEKKGLPVSRCEIYVVKKQGEVWSLPERLRDYINLEGATTTHPYVIYNGATEILYFASDRPGGFGGMDIWYITRDINSKDFDFTYPVNCGEIVNTPVDEISPYYDLEEATLYFSSNGHVSVGGFDIHSASGSRSQWKNVENVGPPFNTSADDLFFVRSPSKRMGFFVSNRKVGKEKTSTADEDIFQFFYELGDLNEDYPQINGFVYDQLTGEILSNVDVEVYEMTDTGEKFLAGKDRFASGNYSFTLLNNRKYEISARKPGYEPGTASLNTSGIRPTEKGYSTPIFLKKVSRAAPPPFVPGSPPPTPALQTAANSQEEAYRIQISAVRNYDAMRFASLEEIGQLLTEEIPGKGLVRVMIGDFPSLNEAQQYQEKVAKKGFKGTIIVLYENGKRVRTID